MSGRVFNSSVESVDEIMVKFKGMSTMRQYLPGKLVKRGYKIWASWKFASRSWVKKKAAKSELQSSWVATKKEISCSNFLWNANVGTHMPENGKHTEGVKEARRRSTETNQ
ncbi:hypothetical protein CEXT_111831 [Caerostris extrusa]|uniref:Transposase n=1 Tax=Caerostris extrusa TaxID=172846 RepID=A0AAV4MAG6_CAEEX|nr:hypothetical protein CEXT_111831 [Caerostris extrusa]